MKQVRKLLKPMRNNARATSPARPARMREILTRAKYLNWHILGLDRHRLRYYNIDGDPRRKIAYIIREYPQAHHHKYRSTYGVVGTPYNPAIVYILDSSPYGCNEAKDSALQQVAQQTKESEILT